MEFISRTSLRDCKEVKNKKKKKENLSDFMENKILHYFDFKIQIIF